MSHENLGGGGACSNAALFLVQWLNNNFWLGVVYVLLAEIELELLRPERNFF